MSNAFGIAVLLWASAGIGYSASSSSLTGTVVDPSGRAVPGAKVIVRNTATLVDNSVCTNSEGIFDIPGLPAGTYLARVVEHNRADSTNHTLHAQTLALLHPAAIATTVLPVSTPVVFTLTGTRLLSVVPSPSCPS